MGIKELRDCRESAKLKFFNKRSRRRFLIDINFQAERQFYFSIGEAGDLPREVKPCLTKRSRHLGPDQLLQSMAACRH